MVTAQIVLYLGLNRMRKKQRQSTSTNLKEIIATPYGPLELRALRTHDFLLIWNRHKRLFDQVVAEHVMRGARWNLLFIAPIITGITVSAAGRVPNDDQRPPDAHKRHCGIEPE
jgi:hypothetical protein